MLRLSTVIVIFLLIAANATFAQTARRSRAARTAAIITALTRDRSISGVYGDDGAGLWADSPSMRRIGRLGDGAVPLLIEYLDDRRVMPHLSRNVSDVDKPVRVGEFCFSLLTWIIDDDPHLYEKDCRPVDSAGDCLKPRYGGPFKAAWRDAYNRGWARAAQETEFWVR